MAAELIGLVAGAVIGAAAGALRLDKTILALTASVPFLVALILRIVRERRADDHTWFDGRAVAETVKTQAWRYMMRVPPFDDDATADREFARELGAVLRARLSFRQALDAVPEASRQISDAMRSVRGLSAQDRRDLYLRERLTDQAEWYRRSALRHQRTAGRWSWASLVAEAIAIVAALAVILSEVALEFGLLGVAGALAAAFTAWAQLGRHDELARSYSLAFQELLLISTLAGEVETDAALLDLVRDGEAAISREHTMWIAKRADSMPISEGTMDQVEGTAEEASGLAAPSAKEVNQ
jgi:hypothetical protein